MNRSMFTQSGELVTISRLKIKEKWKFLRSLRFRITVILVIIGIVPCVILEKSIVNSYEDRAVSVRSITVKNQCDIICNQLIQQNYMEDPGSDVINGQLSMLTNIYGGRILSSKIRTIWTAERRLSRRRSSRAFRARRRASTTGKTTIWK